MNNIATKYALLFFALCGCFTAAMGQRIEKKGGYTFIEYEPISMYVSDSIEVWGRHKFASTDLNIKDGTFYHAALTPAYQFAQYRRYTYEIPDEELRTIRCFCTTEGMIQQCINYMAVVAGDTLLIDTHEKFREIFAPVESVQEAIAFAYIFTGSELMYDFDFLKSSIQPQYHYFELPVEKEIVLNNGKKRMETVLERDSIKLVQRIDQGWEIYQPTVTSSYAKQVEGGYELLMYYYTGLDAYCMERIIKVRYDGHVEITGERAAFRERKEAYSIE